MNAALELSAARAMYAARLLSSALHDPGPWTMRWGPIEVPAVRRECENGVHFSAVFPAHCWLEPPEPNMLLCLRGEVVGLRSIEHPGDVGFLVTWALATQHEHSE